MPTSQTAFPETKWHLQNSTPQALLHYTTPTRPLIPQISHLTHRFRQIHALCENPISARGLLRLRNALAFHLVKMSRWWGFDICPRALTGIHNPTFLTYVHAHLEQSLEDEMLYDVFTTQHYMHPGEGGHILVLHQETDPKTSLRTLYGLDGQRGFRFANVAPEADPNWNSQTYPDFPSAWLAASTVRAFIANDAAAMNEYRAAQPEYATARRWQRAHLHICCDRQTARNYAQAADLLEHCQSNFGRTVFETIVNDLAFRIAWSATDRNLTIADALDDAGVSDISPRAAIAIKRRARLHVVTSLDESRRMETNAKLDRLLTFLPRRCP